jgi:DNA invertase Pin-like site-specific DNA recombinase
MKSELITPQHLVNKAIIYIRQSTPNQALTNQESLELQYALQQKAVELGWSPNNIEVIDKDLGLTGASASHREGFKEILTQVTLGQVGIILSYDVTRLSRNCSDWYPLLDLCGYRHCLIADRDGIYDPGSTNGRLLLGLKGQLAEVELSTIRARMTAGLLNKAQRGDLALQLPIGLVRNAYDQVQKDPNLEIQHRIQLIFDMFLKLKTATKVLRYFNEQSLSLPRYNRFKECQWKKPKISTIINVLKNPAYAGAFVYGRSRVIRNGPSVTDKSIKKLSQKEWKILVKDKYPAYVSWEVFEKIQEMLKDNYAEYDRNKTRGIPRPGEALLHGIVYCGECGHKMLVQYKKGTQYICNALRQQYGTPVCQTIPGNPIDAEVIKAFFKALSPIELDAYTQAVNIQTQTDNSARKAHLQQLERLHYQAKIAERQFNQVDPDNRLVAAELERRWENSLRELKEAEKVLENKKNQITPVIIPEEIRIAFLDIGKKLPDIWNKSFISQQNKKSFLRCLIDKVVIYRCERDTIDTRIVWKGGESTTLKITVTVGAIKDLSFSKEMEKQIINLARSGKTDQEIADFLNEKGYHSPMKISEVLLNTVKCIRLKNRIFVKRSQSHPRHVEGYLTISEIVEKMKVSHHWIYDRIHNGKIKIAPIQVGCYKNSLYLFPDTEDTLRLFEKLKHKR